MFNFGYLPGGDHSVATRPETSLRAVSEAMGLLKEGGVISLVFTAAGIPDTRRETLFWLT